ncbi:MAG: hypothetical protein ACRDWY_15600 [Actinomycetes bacterium]
MERPELEADRLVEVLYRHEVRYVLIGGLAAIIHGSPFPTEDLDIAPETSRDNLARLSDALRELGATICASEVEGPLPFNHNADSLADASVWNLVTSHGGLDLSMTPAGTRGYSDLVRDAGEATIGGVVVTVASLADVIRSKQAANRNKDLRVLPVLREILARRLHERSEQDG